eukprot:11164486-Lingulodinium_polyedra.AAC.1
MISRGIIFACGLREQFASALASRFGDVAMLVMFDGHKRVMLILRAGLLRHGSVSPSGEAR